MFQQKVVTIGSLTAEQLRSTLPSTGSVTNSSRSPQTGPPFNRLPPDLYQLRITLDQRLIASVPASVSVDVLRESAEGQRAALARLLESRAKQEHPIGDRPTVVLTRGQDMTPGIAENHAGLARLSTNSRHGDRGSRARDPSLCAVSGDSGDSGRVHGRSATEPIAGAALICD